MDFDDLLIKTLNLLKNNQNMFEIEEAYFMTVVKNFFLIAAVFLMTFILMQIVF